MEFGVKRSGFRAWRVWGDLFAEVLIVQHVPLVEGRHHNPDLVWALGVQSLIRNVERFLGGLVFKAHRLLHHTALGSRAMKKKK